VTEVVIDDVYEALPIGRLTAVLVVTNDKYEGPSPPVCYILPRNGGNYSLPLDHLITVIPEDSILNDTIVQSSNSFYSAVSYYPPPLPSWESSIDSLRKDFESFKSYLHQKSEDWARERATLKKRVNETNAKLINSSSCDNSRFENIESELNKLKHEVTVLRGRLEVVARRK
jgi:hypothetical protein